ncbi:MAG TPA: hypothetical protein VMH04_08195 [Candidatus Solibacter sp.]|nr:hypothetical protein [Candidatus Solibacter sp.]
MKIRPFVAIGILATMLAGPGSAWAAPQCFSPFSGVYIMFEQPVTSTLGAVHGRSWGALASCAGLSSWPLVGSAHYSKADGLVVAFRVFTVDAATCGAIDYIGTLSGSTLSGPFQLFNQRTNFGNSGTWTEIPCPAPPEEPIKPVAGVDVNGNSTK